MRTAHEIQMCMYPVQMAINLSISMNLYPPMANWSRKQECVPTFTMTEIYKPSHKPIFMHLAPGLCYHIILLLNEPFKYWPLHKVHIVLQKNRKKKFQHV